MVFYSVSADAGSVEVADDKVNALLVGTRIVTDIDVAVALVFNSARLCLGTAYECQACGHRYVPTYSRVNLAAHMGRTRYMKCPECGKRTWQKKVLTREKLGE